MTLLCDIFHYFKLIIIIKNAHKSNKNPWKKYGLPFITGIEKRKMLTQVLSKSNKTDSTPTGFLLLNGCGQKTIICDEKSAPSGYQPGETIIDRSSII